MSAPYTDPGGFSRRLLPKPSHVPSENTEEPPARKRQGVLLACDRCRKRKVKCDGQRPSCLCCLKADTECKYTTRGTALAQRYGGLQQSHSQLKLAMEVLCTGTEQDAVNALKRMREAQSHENIILGDYTTTLQRPLLFSDQGPASVTSFQERGIAHHVPAAPAFPLLEQDRPLPLSRWTTISDDDYLLTHVFKLFWTWDTTVSRLVHRDLLIKAIYSLQNGEESDGGQLNSHFCAEALINAILAYTVECFVATKEHKVQLRGCDFAKESYRTLNIRQGHETVALLQAATILSIYEHAFGDSNKGAGGFCRSLRDLGSANRLFDERSLPNNAETTSNMQPTRSFILSGLYYLNV
ncbi:hypothetical protein QQS21_000377 [Conoideocrella luteorostrata]|uniref:Zn(2)-C6 fungal-type domain-containing protein n=1 Tax=Conoideocrella luteorostrata TaxID=1105319 RepID=A0AAJ0D000_9HYPO|nr:hypothetical protein QQS21_000377 [Conoideocrella luteorostrata]